MRTAASLLLATLLLSAGEAQELVLKLRTRRVSVELEKASLSEFLDFMRTAVGINIVVKKNVIAKTIDPDAIEITLKVSNLAAIDAMLLALEPLDLAMKAERNILYVTTRKDALGKPALVLYGVADLLAPVTDFPAPDIGITDPEAELPEPEVHRAVESVEELVELIRTFTGRDTWEDEGIRITPMRDKIFIAQYPHVHREIRRLLDEVRALR